MKNHCRLWITVAFAVVTNTLSAQSLLSSGGATQSTSAYTISWSLGELMIGTFNNNNYQLTQGLHQGITIESEPPPLGLEEKFSADIYPNPVNEWVTITNNFSSQPWNYELIDLNGKVTISEANINSPEKVLDLTMQKNGLYFLKISEGDLSQLFKIIINH